MRPYIADDGAEIPVETQVGVSLVMLGLSHPAEGTRDALRLIAHLDKVGVAFGDMRRWRREFLRGHVTGENEDHRLAGVIADQADEIDRLRARLADLEGKR